MREYDAETPFEDSFISLKLTIKENDGIIEPKISFDDSLDNVQMELEKIIDLIVGQS